MRLHDAVTAGIDPARHVGCQRALDRHARHRAAWNLRRATSGAELRGVEGQVDRAGALGFDDRGFGPVERLVAQVFAVPRDVNRACRGAWVGLVVALGPRVARLDGMVWNDRADEEA